VPIAFTKFCRGRDGCISEGPEYETLYSFGSACGNGDIERVVQADMLCDQWGIDTISAGVTIAFLMECVQRGLLAPADLDGLTVEFGRGEVFPELIRKMATGEGVGALLGDGVERARQRLGIADDSFCMHAKGMELGGYDPRGIMGQALVFSAGPRGGCHHANGYVIAEEIGSGKWDRFAIAGKGELVRRARGARVIFDSAIYCAFAGVAGGMEVAAQLLGPATGLTYDVASLLHLAERSSNVERAFNVREGLRRAGDTLPRRLLAEPLPEGPSQGHVVDLPALLDEFYAACGWDLRSGVPTRERLEALGLPDIADDMAAIVDLT
jgi:aldehyde:ferredoxin oxidoreductase